MAEETVDRCIQSANLQPKNACVTKGLILTGGEKWTPTSYIRLVQDYGIETEVNTTEKTQFNFSFFKLHRSLFIFQIPMVIKQIKLLIYHH
jgi:hypothetical protein